MLLPKNPLLKKMFSAIKSKNQTILLNSLLTNDELDRRVPVNGRAGPRRRHCRRKADIIEPTQGGAGTGLLGQLLARSRPLKGDAVNEDAHGELLGERGAPGLGALEGQPRLELVEAHHRVLVLVNHRLLWPVRCRLLFRCLVEERNI